MVTISASPSKTPFGISRVLTHLSVPEGKRSICTKCRTIWPSCFLDHRAFDEVGMVYDGKPSRNCLQCRKRRLHCDLRKDTCGQCARAKLICSGYRDPEKLRFQDEGKKARQKVLTRSKGIPQPLVVSIEDRAKNAFFNHYVTGFSKAYDVLDCLPQDKHLAASIDAVSLAFFAFQFDSPQVSRIASEKYLSALPLLNKALKPSRLATNDSTLLAVMLLDLFEKIVNKNPRSTKSWMSHVYGALALINLRGSKLFAEYAPLRLSVRLSTNLLITCVVAHTPVPSALVKLRSDLEPFLNKDDPKWQTSGLVVKYSNLQGRIDNQTLSRSQIIKQAGELDQRFFLLMKNMPDTWRVGRTHIITPSDKVRENYYDVYPDHITAQTWNVIRTMRIFLNDIIRTQSVLITDLDSWCTDATVGLIDDICRDICASAPQFTLPASQVCTKSSPFPDSTSTTEDQAHMLRSYTLLFPLYVAALYASPQTLIKEWVIRQMRFIADDMGVKNAGVVAGILEVGRWVSPWDVYAILGSYAFAA